MADFTTLLKMAAEQQASDLHLSIGYPPLIRLHGQLQVLFSNVLAPEDLHVYYEHLTTPALRQIFSQTGHLDFAYFLASYAESVGRNIANCYYC